MSVTKDIKVSENLKSQFVISSVNNTPIASKIVVFRGVQVMIDRDLAELYEIVEHIDEQILTSLCIVKFFLFFEEFNNPGPARIIEIKTN